MRATRDQLTTELQHGDADQFEYENAETRIALDNDLTRSYPRGWDAQTETMIGLLASPPRARPSRPAVLSRKLPGREACARRSLAGRGVLSSPCGLRRG